LDFVSFTSASAAQAAPQPFTIPYLLSNDVTD